LGSVRLHVLWIGRAAGKLSRACAPQLRGVPLCWRVR
jgi:hypothetical protein